MAEPERIMLDEIFVDETLQTRALSGPVDPKLVEEYADEMRRGASFPPIDVFTGDWTPPDQPYAAVDGFHRVEAARIVQTETRQPHIQSVKHVGTRRDALLYSVGANHTHGQRVTSADKRKKVNLLLDDPGWSNEFDTVIARWAGVSSTFVGNLRRERAAALNGLTVEEDAERVSDVFTGQRDALQSAIEFVSPTTHKPTGYLFWDPNGKPEPAPSSGRPPPWEQLPPDPPEAPTHPAVDKLAATFGVAQPSFSSFITLGEQQAQRLVGRLGDLKPGELAEKPLNGF